MEEPMWTLSVRARRRAAADSVAERDTLLREGVEDEDEDEPGVGEGEGGRLLLLRVSRRRGITDESPKYEGSVSIRCCCMNASAQSSRAMTPQLKSWRCLRARSAAISAGHVITKRLIS